jgi:hypothetical protein
VGTGNKGTMENRVGSGGGKQDAVKERDTVKERYLGRRTDAPYFVFFFPCHADGSLSVRTRC